MSLRVSGSNTVYTAIYKSRHREIKTPVILFVYTAIAQMTVPSKASTVYTAVFTNSQLVDRVWYT